MKIEIKETKTKEIEVSIPCYVKYSDSYHFYVYSEEHCIQVCEGYLFVGISKQFTSTALGNDFKPCTKEEFEKVYNKVSKELKKLIV
jgi:hypothetical protein